MTNLREAAVMALAALEEINKLSISPGGIALPGEIDTAMDMLRAAIVPIDCSDSHQPVAWIWTFYDIANDRYVRRIIDCEERPNLPGVDLIPLYTEPPQREPLSEEDIQLMKPVWADFAFFRAGVRQAERAHGIGGEE